MVLPGDHHYKIEDPISIEAKKKQRATPDPMSVIEIGYGEPLKPPYFIASRIELAVTNGLGYHDQRKGLKERLLAENEDQVALKEYLWHMEGVHCFTDAQRMVKEDGHNRISALMPQWTIPTYPEPIFTTSYSRNVILSDEERKELGL